MVFGVVIVFSYGPQALRTLEVAAQYPLASLLCDPRLGFDTTARDMYPQAKDPRRYIRRQAFITFVGCEMRVLHCVILCFHVPWPCRILTGRFPCEPA